MTIILSGVVSCSAPPSHEADAHLPGPYVSQFKVHGSSGPARYVVQLASTGGAVADAMQQTVADASNPAGLIAQILAKAVKTHNEVSLGWN